MKRQLNESLKRQSQYRLLTCCYLDKFPMFQVLGSCKSGLPDKISEGHKAFPRLCQQAIRATLLTTRLQYLKSTFSRLHENIHVTSPALGRYFCVVGFVDWDCCSSPDLTGTLHSIHKRPSSAPQNTGAGPRTYTGRHTVHGITHHFHLMLTKLILISIFKENKIFKSSINLN